MELGCRFLVQYICREMLINAYEVFCPSVPVCIKIVDGGARRRRRAVCAVPFTSTYYFNIPCPEVCCVSIVVFNIIRIYLCVIL